LKEIESFFAGNLEEAQEVLVAEEQGTLVAFAELSIRMALPVATGRRVGYVEGLYVLPTFRNSGLARQLLRAARVGSRRELLRVLPATGRSASLSTDASARRGGRLRKPAELVFLRSLLDKRKETL
jgi:ribosomal protein S18 acetylase RimI-like enzyme